MPAGLLALQRAGLQLMTAMTCTDCRHVYTHLHVLLDSEAAHPRCLACLLQLALLAERYGNHLVVSVERAPVVAA